MAETAGPDDSHPEPLGPDATGEAARPASVEDLKTLLKALAQEKVDYLLISGYALYTLGYQRGTTGIDVLMRPTRERRTCATRLAPLT